MHFLFLTILLSVVFVVQCVCSVLYMQKKTAAQTCTMSSQGNGQIFMDSYKDVIWSIFMGHILKTPQRHRNFFYLWGVKAHRFAIFCHHSMAQCKKGKILWLGIKMPEDIKCWMETLSCFKSQRGDSTVDLAHHWSVWRCFTRSGVHPVSAEITEMPTNQHEKLITVELNVVETLPITLRTPSTQWHMVVVTSCQELWRLWRRLALCSDIHLLYLSMYIKTYLGSFWGLAWLKMFSISWVEGF